MLDFNTGDDIPQIDFENIEEDIDYILSERVSSEEVIILEAPTSPADIQLEVSPIPVVDPQKKKRKRIRKGGWVCSDCRHPFSSKQNLTEHMENVKMCLKRQKRLEDAEQIQLAPHEDLGSTLQACIDTLKDHQRLNEPVKAK